MTIWNPLKEKYCSLKNKIKGNKIMTESEKKMELGNLTKSFEKEKKMLTTTFINSVLLNQMQTKFHLTF